MRALVAATAPTPVQPVDSGSGTGTACPKCGTTKKGKVSCCANGGSWFEKCGDPGDPQFEHTWDDGVNACKGKYALDCILSLYK